MYRVVADISLFLSNTITTSLYCCGYLPSINSYSLINAGLIISSSVVPGIISSIIFEVSIEADADDVNPLAIVIAIDALFLVSNVEPSAFTNFPSGSYE